MSYSTTIASCATACRTPNLRISVAMLSRFVTNPDPFSIVPGSTFPSATIGELSVSSTAKVVSKGALDRPRPLIDLENVSPWGGISDVATVESIGSSRLEFGNADILTAKLRPYLGKTIHNELPDALGTTEWIPLKIDSNKLRPRLLGYLLQSPLYVSLSSAFMAGKEHPRINPDDILRLKVPLPPAPLQEELLARLDALNAQCVDLESQLGEERDLVNRYFERSFRLDLAMLDAEKMKKRRVLKISEVAANSDWRFSFKYHAPSVQFALHMLRSKTVKRIADVLAEPIVLGASISPSDYSADTDKFYFSMASIRSWAFDPTIANRISEQFFIDNGAKCVQANDILMARSGEGTIGKVALIPSDVEGVCSDFTMRIKLNPQACDPEFARFYFMTEYFQHIVYGEKKGLGNNTNIFPIQLKDLPFLDVPLAEQKAVVKDLNALIEVHTKERAQIANIRKEMSDALTSGMAGAPSV
jgi:type I restriction enzyme, S subunit